MPGDSPKARSDGEAVVWFKRDLRMAAHAPLAEASRCDAALSQFIIEPPG